MVENKPQGVSIDFSCPKCGQEDCGPEYIEGEDALRLYCRRCKHVWRVQPLDKCRLKLAEFLAKGI